PAGFYAAQYILKHLQGSHVDLIEKLPVPYGLVRFGVAPDHPEVKNVINTFRKTAENPCLKFYGNISLGTDVTLKELQENYHAVLLAYGADKDKKFDLPNEDLLNVISARDFVAWYNGLPGAQTFNPDLSGETVTLLGQGNVAIDVARILLSPISSLEKTDITDYALDRLKESRVKEVYLIGRRGPLQAAFTIKELREMLKLPGVSTIWRRNDFEGVNEIVSKLQRPRKRITELMLKSLEENQNIGQKKFIPIFFRSPIQINANDNQIASVDYAINKLENERAISTDAIENIPTQLICRSIGYKSECLDHHLNFDNKNGCVSNVGGRVLKKQSNGADNSIDIFEDKFETGLYVTGWLATGPTGVILSTMNSSFSVADVICKDFENNTIKAHESKSGINFSKKCRPVTWEGWERIDKVEIEKGMKGNKPREKITDINEMLKITGA
ncbi:unnamed protein product, partial [Sphagnum compactum]